MNDLLPLALHPWPVPEEHLSVVRAAKAALNLPFRVSPCQAVPASPTRVLALGSLPPFVCDCAPVSDPLNVESVKAALLWVLDPEQPLERGYTVVDYLQAAFGPGLREITDSWDVNPVDLQVKSGVRFE